MNGDEQLLRGRVYGQDHDHPNPGPLEHRTYAELVGGLRLPTEKQQVLENLQRTSY
ncbi:hypothetical protein ACF1G0_34795 [Streptomyces sp. NPDC013953]|uniref:hypothetical protein n=1 Tax=Streptomyces sp. NPDC013953 TaxID=3364868 RepID=UPI0036FA3227